MNAPITDILDPATADLVPAPSDSASVTAAEAVYIILPSGNVSITAAAIQVFTIIGKTLKLFYRGGRVHRIAKNPDGSRRLEPIIPAQFRSIIEQFGRIFRWVSGANGEPVLKPAVCPEQMAGALLESEPARELLPNVAVLSACPVLAADGDEMRVLGPGWHPLGGGILVTGGVAPPQVPILEAVKALKDLLADFDFATAGDRSRALASLIAPGLRFGSWLANPLPIDIGEADASQSGKTYRQKVVAAIYREIPNVVVQRTGGVGSVDEGISQKLIDGRPFVLFDNVRGKLDTQFLESLLTAPGPMPARVPHRAEIQIDPRGFVFQMTSNGVETTADLANRASLIAIRKRPQSFGFRVYPEGDLHAHVIANQAYYLGCVYSVIADWITQGRQRTTETGHHFREWAQTLDWIVQNIFSAAPLLNGYQSARERISDPRRVWLRALCIALRDGRQTGDLYATQLAEFAIESDITPPNVRPDAEESSVARAIGKIMAAVFGETDEIQIDGFRICRSRRYSSTAEKEIPVYSFDEGEPA